MPKEPHDETAKCAKCQSPATSTCKSCQLVVYCGRDCQKDHWSEHKKWCKSPLMKADWLPLWATQNRQPAFIGGPPQHIFGGKKYFWGNVPALDVLKLAVNEGATHDKSLKLLFAASGDLRNMLKTLVAVPGSYCHAITSVINDRNFDIVARNIIIMLTAFVIPDKQEAASCMLHLWYSVLLTGAGHKVIYDNVRPLIQDVNAKIAGKAFGALCGKTWSFEVSSVRVVLTKKAWATLLSYFEVPDGMTPNKAVALRKAITVAEERVNYRERAMFGQTPPHRTGMSRFLEEGILLPFGKSRKPFDQVNPTFFQSAEWPMKDGANPLDGWSLAEVTTQKSAAVNDVYGKLHNHIMSLLSDFHSEVRNRSRHFQFFRLDAEKLPEQLERSSFDRIEVANISDAGYLGIAKTLHSLGDLLQPSMANSSATLLTLFMNAIGEMDMRDPTGELEDTTEDITRAYKYFPGNLIPRTRYDPRMVQMAAARPLVRDTDKVFARYMKQYHFEEMQEVFDFRFQMKANHTIVDKWPMKLKLKPGQPGAQEEFDRAVSSGCMGTERYVEWKRLA